VKEYLREADNVWIVANIKRAVNDKTAKNMLGESFRRQLLMDGQYGQVRHKWTIWLGFASTAYCDARHVCTNRYKWS